MLLSYLIAIPVLGALPLLLTRDRNAREIKVWAFLVSVVTFLVSLPLWNISYEPKAPQFQFVEHHAWISLKSLTINFDLGVDGVSALLVLLSTVITPLAILGSWNYIKDRQKEFYVSMLILEAAIIGVFCATDLFLFYVFFEASLIPMYLIIGVWGGDEKLYATTKFIIYTAFGSLLMFVALLYIYFKAAPLGPEGPTFSISLLTERLAALRSANLDNARSGLSIVAESWCFWAFALAFAIKVPLFPVHTWLPDAHVQAPTPGSVILASLLLKIGGYGFIRFVIPFFPRAAELNLPVLIVLCLIGIIYGSMMAFVQKDMKKLVAYSSVAHMGTCMLGIFSLTLVGVQGGVYQMINHGISTGALFLLVGMLYERAHTRSIDQFGGLAKVIPAYTIFFVIVTLSSIGLPLTNGFISEFTCLLGAYLLNPWYAFWGATGMILGAVYMLYLVKRVFFGTVTRDSNLSLAPLSGREFAILTPLVALIFILGVAPTPFFARMEPAAKKLLEQAAAGRSVQPPRPERLSSNVAQSPTLERESR